MALWMVDQYQIGGDPGLGVWCIITQNTATTNGATRT